MAKYEVKHSCDHVEVVQLVGLQKERDRKLAWLEQQVCPACVQAERVKVAQGLVEMQSAAGLPSLSGSEKQITWAAQIRHDFLFACDKIDKRLQECVYSESPSGPVAEQLLFELDEIRSKWQKERFAQVWIDHRQELTESGVSSTLAVVRDQIADKLTAPITRDFPLSDADKREILKLAIESRQAELAAKRLAESARREAADAEKESAKENETSAEQEKQQQLWARKDEIATAIPEDWRGGTLTIWNKEGRDKRVYYESRGSKVCLYVVGNRYNRPGSIVMEGNGKGSAELFRPAFELANNYFRQTTFRVTAEGKAK